MIINTLTYFSIVFIIVLEAAKDAVYDNGVIKGLSNPKSAKLKTLSKLFQFVQYLIFGLSWMYLPLEWKDFIGAILLGIAIFAPTYNKLRGLKWNYLGSTSIYDKIMKTISEHAPFYFMILLVCFLIGTSLIWDDDSGYNVFELIWDNTIERFFVNL